MIIMLTRKKLTTTATKININKLYNLTEIDLSRNKQFVDDNNYNIELFTIVDETVYVKLAILYNTLEQSNILSTEFLEHRTAFINAADKCFIDITKPIQKQIIDKLNHNKMITQYKQLIHSNTIVKSLNLSYNSLKLLPFEIGHLITITNLDLSNNQLLTLPPEIGNLINITKLNLSNNQLLTFPSEIFNLINITNLDLSNNQLSELPLEIFNLINITNLDLSNNQLLTLPSEIFNLINITKLNLSNNQIDKISSKIGKLINLTQLNLSNNQILTLPSKISKLVNLTEFICKYEYDSNINESDYINFDDIDINDYDNHIEILDKFTHLDLHLEDFEDYYYNKVEDEYSDQESYYAANPKDAYYRAVVYSWDNTWENFYQNNNEYKAEIWNDNYINEYEADIYDAIKEYKKEFFNNGYYINKINSKIFTLPNINTLSFSSKGKNINSMFKNIINVGAKSKLIDFLEDEIPYYVDMTKTNDKWEIELTHYITFDSHII